MTKIRFTREGIAESNIWLQIERVSLLSSTLLSRLVTRTSLHGFSPKLLKGLEIHVQLDDRAFRHLLSLLRFSESRSTH